MSGAQADPERRAMSTIVAIDVSHHRLALDPPSSRAVDPRPRTHFPATIV
jgi:hypothetical protein